MFIIGRIVQQIKRYFVCKYCGKEVENIHRLKNPIYCSRKCKAEYSKEESLVKRICLQCSKEFVVKKGCITKKSPCKFCSIKCAGLWKTGKNNPLYKNGQTLSSNGYIIIKYDGKRMHRSRVAMIEFLGRDLLKHEEVHHKDGNKTNDDISNLELWSHSHPAGQRVEDKILWAKELLESYSYQVIAQHDRDINAAKVILNSGLGYSLDNVGTHAFGPETSKLES